ncbi:hypothetical protein MTO96_048023 [Rhipicephalus appendiculatus]|uniref:Secreted protein n=1 Tax=Rhipicephalus appendiculatus TaxID=34631 RepID=A0A131Z490_RHIAP
MRAVLFLLCVSLVISAFVETDARRAKRTTAAMRSTSGHGRGATGGMVVRVKTTPRRHRKKSSGSPRRRRRTTAGYGFDEDD